LSCKTVQSPNFSLPRERSVACGAEAKVSLI
jgi:hypothetical protein